MSFRRLKWKYKNLGHRMFLISLFQKKKIVHFDGNYTVRNQSTDIQLHDDWSNIMLVKPSGVKHLGTIKKTLLARGLLIREIFVIKNYEDVLNILFPSISIKESAYWRQINNDYYCKDGHVEGRVIVFEKNTNFEILEKIKIRIRRQCGIDFYCIKDRSLPLYETSITPVHVPDLENMQKEYSIVINYSTKIENMLNENIEIVDNVM